MTDEKTTSNDPPAPEVLKPQSDDGSSATKPSVTLAAKAKSLRRTTYRPSHKATFIGLAVVVGILVINAAIIMFVLQSQSSPQADANQNEVTLSSASLDKLGVTRTPVGNLGTELVVGPNSRFNGTVTVGSDVSIAGGLKLNSTFSAADASLTKLAAGDTSLEQLNVNGDGTLSNINARKDLTVAGTTRLQGSVTISQLLTVNNNVNVAGNLAIGGILSARSFQASSLTSDTTLTIGGHIITRGSAPSVAAGGGVGSNGTVSISGNDASGTVAVNVGTGGGNGMLAQVAFRSQYGGIPHIVVTAIGRGAGNMYITRSSTGFTINTSDALSPGGYMFDYIVMQ